MSSFDFKQLTCDLKDDGQRVEVTVIVSRNDVDIVMNEFYELMAKVNKIKYENIEDAKNKLNSSIGEDSLVMATRDYLTNRFTTAVLNQLDYDTVLTPGVHVEEYPQHGCDFAFVANLVLRPELSLSSTEPIDIKRPKVYVEESDIDGQLAYTSLQFTTFKTIERSVLQEGDFALVDIDIVKNGKVEKDLSGIKRLIEVKSGLLPTALIAGMVGMNCGDIKKVEFKIKSDEPFLVDGRTKQVKDNTDDKVLFTDVNSTSGKSGKEVDDYYSADVRLWEIQEKVIPIINDDWIKKNLPQFEDLHGFRNYIRNDCAARASRTARIGIPSSLRSRKTFGWLDT